MMALTRLLVEDFSRTCAPDRACGACHAPFCGHCCGEHHRGHGGVTALKPPEGEAEAGQELRRVRGGVLLRAVRASRRRRPRRHARPRVRRPPLREVHWRGALVQLLLRRHRDLRGQRRQPDDPSAAPAYEDKDGNLVIRARARLEV
ncbi:unnamed protein product [Urochloa humidicola]